MPVKLILRLLVIAVVFTAMPLTAQEKATQAAHLERFSECFAVDNFSNDEIEQVNRLITDPPCFRLCWLTNAQGFFMLAFFPDHFSNELRSCYYSQSAIRGAMKMYNAEHPIKLHKLTDALINGPDSPLMPDYLKHPFPKSSNRCQYKSYGDLVNGNLIIYCTYHGAPAGDQSNSDEIKDRR